MNVSFALIIAMAAFGSSASQKHSLLPHVKVGDTFPFEYRSTTTVNAKPSQFNAVFIMSVASLEPKGTITFNTEQRSSEIVTDGKSTAIPDSTTKTTFKLNGELLSTEPAYASPEQARFGQLMAMVVPEKPTGVGDTWTWKVEPSAANGSVGVKAKGECATFENRLGVSCARLKLSAEETSGSKPAKCAMEVWFSLIDGLPVEIHMEMTDVPLGRGVVGSIKAVNKRKSGLGGVMS